MCDVVDLQEKYVILLGKSFGLGVRVKLEHSTNSPSCFPTAFILSGQQIGSKGFCNGRMRMTTILVFLKGKLKSFLKN